jgi:hypothetical protein
MANTDTLTVKIPLPQGLNLGMAAAQVLMLSLATPV